MKSLILLIRSIINRSLFQKRGETLVEGIISILLLAILMTTVTVMIQTSLRQTANSMEDAELLQNLTFNPAVLDDHPNLPEGIIRFVLIIDKDDAMDDITIEAQHDIRIYENIRSIVSFYPDP